MRDKASYLAAFRTRGLFRYSSVARIVRAAKACRRRRNLDHRLGTKCRRVATQHLMVTVDPRHPARLPAETCAQEHTTPAINVLITLVATGRCFRRATNLRQTLGLRAKRTNHRRKDCDRYNFQQHDYPQVALRQNATGLFPSKGGLSFI